MSVVRKPKVSVITVTLNSSKTVVASVNSVIQQTFKNFEHIIIDGNSVDDTVEKVQSFEDKRIKIFSEPDTGIYDAMNKGIDIATGEIVSILNSDDKFYKDTTLETVVKTFDDHCSDIVYSGIIYLNTRGKPAHSWIPSEFNLNSYKKGFHTPHPGFFCKTELYKKLGSFDLNLKIASDFDLMMRFMEHKGVKSTLLNDITVAMSSDGTSSKFKNILRGNSDIRTAFEKMDVKHNSTVYFLKRYMKKLGRKFT